jgi:hypothetical protein
MPIVAVFRGLHREKGRLKQQPSQARNPDPELTRDKMAALLGMAAYLRAACCDRQAAIARRLSGTQGG